MASGGTRAERGRRRPIPWFEAVFLAAGAAFFAALVAKVGTAPLVDAFRLLNVGLLLVVGQEVLAISANAVSWRYAIPRDRRDRVPFWKLGAARVAGDALNYLLPAGMVGGEVPRARLLRPEVPQEQAIASVTIAKLTEAISLAIFGILGAACAIPALDDGRRTDAAVTLGVLLGAAVALAFYVAARRGIYSGAVGVLARLGIRGPRLARLAEGAAAFDEEIGRYLRGSRADFFLSIFWHLVGWLANVLELAIVCWLLGIDAPVRSLVALEGLAACWDAIFFLMPARVGSAEGGRVVTFTLLGFAAEQGLSVALARRVREVTWAGVGLAAYALLARGEETEEKPAAEQVPSAEPVGVAET